MENIQEKGLNENVSFTDIFFGVLGLVAVFYLGILDELRLHLPFKKSKGDAKILEKNTQKRILLDMKDEPCLCTEPMEFTEHSFVIMIEEEETEIVVSQIIFSEKSEGEEVEVNYFSGFFGLRAILA